MMPMNINYLKFLFYCFILFKQSKLITNLHMKEGHCYCYLISKRGLKTPKEGMLAIIIALIPISLQPSSLLGSIQQSRQQSSPPRAATLSFHHVSRDKTTSRQFPLIATLSERCESGLFFFLHSVDSDRLEIQ